MTSISKGHLKIVRLLIFFVLIIIAGSILLNYANKKLQKKKSDDIVTNMLIIEGKIKVINGDNKVNSSENDYLGIKVSEISNEDLKNKIITAGVPEDSLDNYYMLNKSHLETMQILDDLKKVNDEEYVVNYKDCEVIFISGVNIEGNIKYKLSEIKNDKNGETDKEQEDKRQDDETDKEQEDEKQGDEQDSNE